MRKLLVANRSEIAIRCFRAATELGLRTVAVYSHEDRFSLHRFKADEAFLIGPPQGGEPVRSYLNIDNLLSAIDQSGAECVHPGYGFLSEKENFARAVVESRGEVKDSDLAAVRSAGFTDGEIGEVVAHNVAYAPRPLVAPH